jgi:hypothetical protein
MIERWRPVLSKNIAVIACIMIIGIGGKFLVPKRQHQLLRRGGAALRARPCRHPAELLLASVRRMEIA